MTQKLFFLSLFLLFISCTVTKRVHRSGFHVQWHKIHRTEKPDSPKKERLISPSDYQADHSEEIHFPTRQIDVKKTLSLPDLSIPNIRSTQEKKALTKANEVISHTIIPIQKRPSKSSNIRQQSTSSSKHRLLRPLFWRLDAKSLKTIGVVLISVGLLIFFGVLLSTAGAFMGNGASWANFFLDLIEISGWFWLLVFILIIILLLYLAVLLVRYVFLSEFVGLMVGLVLIGLGIFFVVLGNNRKIEP